MNEDDLQACNECVGPTVDRWVADMLLSMSEEFKARTDLDIRMSPVWAVLPPYSKFATCNPGIVSQHYAAAPVATPQLTHAVFAQR